MSLAPIIFFAGARPGRVQTASGVATRQRQTGESVVMDAADTSSGLLVRELLLDEATGCAAQPVR